MDSLHDDLHDLLLRELRAAVDARLAAGADPRDVLADLDRRLEALREMKRRTIRNVTRRPLR
jgi:hypothetical protein